MVVLIITHFLYRVKHRVLQNCRLIEKMVIFQLLLGKTIA
jgi:hypothetical protein